MHELLTTKEVALLLKRSTRTIQRWSADGMLKSYRIAGRSQKYYKKEEIEALMIDDNTRGLLSNTT